MSESECESLAHAGVDAAYGELISVQSGLSMQIGLSGQFKMLLLRFTP